jgi:hypothetical protein
VPVRSVSRHFPLPNRKYPDNIFAVGIFPVGQHEISRQCFLLSGHFLLSKLCRIFPVAQQEISRQPILLSGYFLLCNFVGIFPFGTMSGYFLLGVSGQVRSPYKYRVSHRGLVHGLQIDLGDSGHYVAYGLV